jgi:dolichyl-diphosphooligosaccharide--protein glycosyltransferase
MAKTTDHGRFGALTGTLGSLTPRITRRTALELAVLGLVVVLAVLFRALRVRWGAYMDAFDPLFQLRVTEYVVENGYASWFSWHTMSWYPWGRNIATTSYPGVPFTGAFVYFLARALSLDVTVFQVCLYFPVLMGAITCIVAYFLGRDLGGSSTGLLTAFFMAISEAFIGRTSLGFYDTENIGIFGMTAIALFFLRSLDSDRSLNERLVYGVVAGLSLGYTFASWGATRYIVGLLILFVLTVLVSGRFERRHLLSYSLTLGVGFAIAVFVPKLGTRYLISTENIAAIFLGVLLVVYEVARQKLEERQTMLLIGGLVLALILGVFALEALGVTNPIAGKFLRVINPGGKASENPLSESVAEHKRSVWSSFFGTFGLSFPLAVLGAYFAVHSFDDRRLYSALFFVTAVYFTGSMTRLSLILSIPVSLMAAYGLTELLAPFVVLSRKKAVTGRRRRRVVWQGVSRELSVVFTLFILVAILPTVWSTARGSNRPTSMASSSVPALFGDRYPQDWLQALNWMKDNLADDAVVVSWWDYGYWIEAIGEQTTLADGATTNRSQIGYIGRIMMLNQSESLPMLEAYDATHIVVFHTFNPNTPETQWPFGDNVKWSWMVQIGGLELGDYVDMTNGEVTARYEESTLNRLMTLRPDTGYELAFASDFRFVLVYELNYDA